MMYKTNLHATNLRGVTLIRIHYPSAEWGMYLSSCLVALIRE